MGLVTAEDDPVVVSVRGPLPAGTLGEVRLHQQIYQRRVDVQGIVRYQSPRLMSLSSMGRTPLARHGFGSYFAPHAPLWRDPRLVRDDDRAAAAADLLGQRASYRSPRQRCGRRGCLAAGSLRHGVVS
jgi:HCOMODA/2-hydroxy-3-carboxy-muconic semialdehyde decarboxylase